MSKEDIANKLEQREAKRKQSVVKNMISDQNLNIQTEQEKKEAEGKMKVSDFITITSKETRSKRISSLVRPSIYVKVKKKCKKMGLSVNDVINQLLEQFSEE